MEQINLEPFVLTQFFPQIAEFKHLLHELDVRSLLIPCLCHFGWEIEKKSYTTVQSHIQRSIILSFYSCAGTEWKESKLE